MTLPKLPATKAGWASLILGVGLLAVGCAHWLQGNTSQACLDFSGAFGTLGLPNLAVTAARPAPIPPTKP